MNRYRPLLALILLPLASLAQQSATPAAPARNAANAREAMKTLYMTAGEVAAKMAQADKNERAGVPDTGPYGLLTQWPFEITMEYRVKAAGHAGAHKLNAELFYVLDGSGTMTLGGTLVNPQETASETRAASATGGTPYKLHKGDILLVPPGVNHAVTQVDDKLAMISMHIPTGDASLWPHNTR